MPRPYGKILRLLLSVAALVGAPLAVVILLNSYRQAAPSPDRGRRPDYQPRDPLDVSGNILVLSSLKRWPPGASLEEVAEAWKGTAYRDVANIDRFLAGPAPADGSRTLQALLNKAMLYNWEGEPGKAYEVLEEARSRAERDPALADKWLYTLIYAQGMTALRRGENDNCVACTGECSCILPIDPSAYHTRPDGSRLAVKHFTEYLRQFPDDLEVRWLLNVAHMTLGEYPQQVDPKYLISLDRYNHPEFDLGKFRDISHRVGMDRTNMSGGAIMDDFDNDGLLDVVVTTYDPTQPMAFYHNKGDGTFEDRTAAAHLDRQVGGGLSCVQTDYNNDGNLDLFIPRGAWLPYPVRSSLLRNNGDGTFTDVTAAAGLSEPANSICATWADYDNDGFLDLFVCCEKQPNRLYHNKGDGTFEEVAARAGVQGDGLLCKGAAWIDYDNDGYPDLFVNNLNGPARLYHNNHDGSFTDVTERMGLTGPNKGFSCWAWDYDNDGWLDIFATSYDYTLEDVVKGLIGQPHKRESNKLYRNLGGKGFQDVTREAGLDMVFSPMGSNFGDFDGDGYLDFYLGTGDPNLSTLVPNRMFKNVGGKRFAEITGPSGTGHLQKGHAVACGDWRRDGLIDVFIEMGGASNGDKYHNILFQNPGNNNSWLTVKLVGKKTNRPAIGARIKAVSAGDKPLTVYRHVSSGSSFGGNPLQQTIGLGKATRVAELEIRWPTSGTTQVFHDIDVNQAIEVTEFAADYRKLDWKPVALPK